MSDKIILSEKDVENLISLAENGILKLDSNLVITQTDFKNLEVFSKYGIKKIICEKDLTIVENPKMKSLKGPKIVCKGNSFNLTDLNLSSIDNEIILEGLEYFIVSNVPLISFKDINGEYKQLVAKGLEIKNLEAFNFGKNTEYISISNSKIESLKGLKAGIQSIDVSNCDVETFDTNIKQIKRVSFKFCEKIKNFKGAPEKIDEFELFYTKFDSFEGLNTVNKFYLVGNEVAITGFEGVKKVKNLIINDEKVKSFKGLKNLNALRINGGSEIESFEGVEKINKIYVETYSSIKTFKPLKEIKEVVIIMGKNEKFDINLEDLLEIEEIPEIIIDTKDDIVGKVFLSEISKNTILYDTVVANNEKLKEFYDLYMVSKKFKPKYRGGIKKLFPKIERIFFKK